MYQDFYQLKADPFRLSPDHAFCFHYPSFTKAKAYMRYGLNAAEGFVLITGRPGMGKTTLISDLLSDLANADDYLICMLVNTQLEATPLLRMVAYEFGLEVQDQDKATVLHKLTEFLIEVSQSQRRPLLIVDEAQNLKFEALEELRLLTNLQFDNRPLLQIFLVGQEALRDKLHDPRLEQLHQRITAACHLDPFTVEQTTAYIIHRLREVGWNGVPKLTAPLFRVIQKISGGIPRRINQFCSRLLLHGSLEEKLQLSTEDATIVVTELDEEHLSRAVSGHDFLAGISDQGTAPGNSESSFRDETLLQQAEDLLLQQVKKKKKIRPTPRIGATNTSPGEGAGLTKEGQSPLAPTLAEPQIIAPMAARPTPTAKSGDEPDSESRCLAKDSGTSKSPESTRPGDNFLFPGRPVSVPLRHTIASLALATQHSRKWLDHVSDALSNGLRRLGTYRPRRHSDRTPARKPSGDYAPSLRSPYRAAKYLFSALSRRPAIAYMTVILLIVAVTLFTLPSQYMKKWLPNQNGLAVWKHDSKPSPSKANLLKTAAGIEPATTETGKPPRSAVIKPLAAADHRQAQVFKARVARKLVNGSGPQIGVQQESGTPTVSPAASEEPSPPLIVANTPPTGEDVEMRSQSGEIDALRSLAKQLAGVAKPSEPEVRRTSPHDDQSGITDGAKAREPEPAMVREIAFGFNSTKISPQARSLLNEVTTRMNESIKWMAHIVGYADSGGPKKYNQHLSRLRAKVVATYLSSQGISYDRLRIEGRGSLQPLPHRDDTSPEQRPERVVRIMLESQD